MLVDAALAFCNHVLTQEAWARDRLKPFAGLNARLHAGAFSFSGYPEKLIDFDAAHLFISRGKPD